MDPRKPIGGGTVSFQTDRRVGDPDDIITAGAGWLEGLEDRRLLAVTIGADGWTAVTPSADTRVVYVSSSSGNDANGGLSAASPVRSLSRAMSLVRDDAADWVLLKSGDAWSEGIHVRVDGRSKDEPLLISSYGSGPRPMLHDARIAVNGDNLAIIGLHLKGPGKANSPTVEGVETDGVTRRNLLIEDVYVEGHYNGLSIPAVQGMTIRRSIVADNRNLGLWTTNAGGFLIEESIFDNNGTDENTNHNIYKGPGVNDFVIRHNIISRGSNYGLKWRAPSDGGEIYGNVFVGNRNDLAIHLDSDNASNLLSRNIDVRDNVFVQSGRSNQQNPIYLSHVDGVRIEGNVIANMNATPYGQAIRLASTFEAAPSNLTNLRIAGNTIANLTGTGIGLLTGNYRGVEVEGNTIQGLTGVVHQIRAAFHPGDITFADNTYHSAALPTQWFEAGYHNYLGLAAWALQSGELNAKAGPVPFPDPTRTTASYHGSLGGTATHAAFVGEARKQSRQSWDPRYAPQAVWSHVRAGFGIGNPVPTPTPAEVGVRQGATAVADGSTTPVAFGTTAEGAAAPKLTFTVTNTGGQTLSLGQVVLTNNAGFEVAQQPSASVAPGASTAFTLRMLTSVAGAKAADVTFTNSDADENPYDFKVAGTVTPPAPAPAAEIDVWYGPVQLTDGSTTTIPFGTRQQFTSPIVYPFTIHNTGGQDLSIGSVTLSNNVGFEVARQPAPVVAPGSSTTFWLRMRTDTLGAKGAVVTFGNSDADESPFDFTVAGAVNAQPAEIEVATGTTTLVDGSTTPVSFGAVREGEAAPERAFVLRNTGGADMYVSALQLPADSGFEVVRQPASYVAAGSSTLFVLRMRSETPGAKSAVVSFANSDGDESPFDFRVAGEVTSAAPPPPPPAPEIDVFDGATPIADGSVTAVSFGTVQRGTTLRERTFTVTNNGGGDLTLGEVRLVGNPAFNVVRQLAAAVLAPGASTTFVLGMKADVVGMPTAGVVLTSNDADESTFDFAVTGTVEPTPGTQEEIDVRDGDVSLVHGQTAPVSFGRVVEGSDPLVRTFHIWNVGANWLRVGTATIVSSSGAFEVVRQPYPFVAPGGYTTIEVRLLTGAPGDFFADVGIPSNDGDETPFLFRVSGTVAPRLIAPLSTGYAAAPIDEDDEGNVFSTARILRDGDGGNLLESATTGGDDLLV